MTALGTWTRAVFKRLGGRGISICPVSTMSSLNFLPRGGIVLVLISTLISFPTSMKTQLLPCSSSLDLRRISRQQSFTYTRMGRTFLTNVISTEPSFPRGARGLLYSSWKLLTEPCSSGAPLETSSTSTMSEGSGSDRATWGCAPTRLSTQSTLQIFSPSFGSCSVLGHVLSSSMGIVFVRSCQDLEPTLGPPSPHRTSSPLLLLLRNASGTLRCHTSSPTLGTRGTKQPMSWLRHVRASNVHMGDSHRGRYLFGCSTAIVMLGCGCACCQTVKLLLGPLGVFAGSASLITCLLPTTLSRPSSLMPLLVPSKLPSCFSFLLPLPTFSPVAMVGPRSRMAPTGELDSFAPKLTNLAFTSSACRSRPPSRTGIPANSIIDLPLVSARGGGDALSCGSLVVCRSPMPRMGHAALGPTMSLSSAKATASPSFVSRPSYLPPTFASCMHLTVLALMLRSVLFGD